MEGRDEFGIPLGEHTLTCGCEMRGRALIKACSQHLHIGAPLTISLDDH